MPRPVSATVSTVGWPAQPVAGPVNAAVGRGVVETTWDDVDEQPLAPCTVTPSVTTPLAPAVKVMERDPPPPVIEPFPINQL